MKKILIGVMGPGEKATPTDLENAYQLGKLIAAAGWVLLTGGRKAGVMDAASRGAKLAGGLTLGILPGKDTDEVSDAVDIAIVTSLGDARNGINVLSSNAVIACGMGLGTASEVALALKNGKSVVLLTPDPISQQFFQTLAPHCFSVTTSPQAAIAAVQKILSCQPPARDILTEETANLHSSQL